MPDAEPADFETTWDGLPISRDPPFGAAVHVWRRRGDEREWLLLHRAHHGSGYEGDWAWTAPSGARLPGESIDDCARRELREETGLELEPVATGLGVGDWALYVAEAPADAEVVVDAEHDRYEWLSLGEALSRCAPAEVVEHFAAAAGCLEQRS